MKFSSSKPLTKRFFSVILWKTFSKALHNEFLIASIFLRDPNTMTIPVGIQMFMQQYSTDWGSLMAAASLASIPTIIFFLFVQKYMVQGVVAGAVKG